MRAGWRGTKAAGRYSPVFRHHEMHALRALPAVPFEACEHMPGHVWSTALVRYRLVDYSASAVHAHKKVTLCRPGRQGRSQPPGIDPEIDLQAGLVTAPRHRRDWRNSCADTFSVSRNRLFYRVAKR